MNSWVRHYMVQDKEELVGMLLSRDEAIKIFGKRLHNKDKEIERLNKTIQIARHNILSDISMIKNEKMSKEEIINRLQSTLFLIVGSDKE